MAVTKILDVLMKSIQVFPTLVSAISEIDAAVKAAKNVESEGGSSLTVSEVATIVALSLGKVSEAVLKIFIP